MVQCGRNVFQMLKRTKLVPKVEKRKKSRSLERACKWAPSLDILGLASLRVGGLKVCSNPEFLLLDRFSCVTRISRCFSPGYPPAGAERLSVF